MLGKVCHWTNSGQTVTATVVVFVFALCLFHPCQDLEVAFEAVTVPWIRFIFGQCTYGFWDGCFTLLPLCTFMDDEPMH